MSVVVEAVSLRKSYRRGPEQVQALRQADLLLRAGELVALVGPSGSGKTTLLNLLCGWEQPDGGRLSWWSTPGRQDLPWREVAVMPQDLGLVGELTAAENVELPLWLTGQLEQGRTAVADLLGRLGLARHADRLPAEMSLGERQRVALARAMIVRPRLLLADEPTAHQDADWAAAMLKAVRDLARQGSCCVVATHSQELPAGVDRVLTISDGELASSGEPSRSPDAASGTGEWTDTETDIGDR
ncbi:MAG TPA: ATP-binding cassette domain-containing protein [Actinomycetes bacterium]|nr:ATP-binding cassette domain-containing protein [Actinomycetes bacterium]